MGNQVHLIGIGPGDPGEISVISKKKIGEAKVLIGANRMLELAKNILYDLSMEDDFEEPEMVAIYRTDEILERILKLLPEADGDICVLYSGDIGFSSGAYALTEKLKEEGVECEWHPGLSSTHYLLKKCRIPWEMAQIISCHGREDLSAENLAFRILRQKYTVILPSDEEQVRDIAKIITQMGRGSIQLTVGNDLSYRSEEIYTMLCSEVEESDNGSVCRNLLSPLAVVFFQNEAPMEDPSMIGIPDDSFIRGSVPMTKQAARCMILSQLRIEPNSVLLDIGAGTGSVSVEAALRMPDGSVTGIEKNSEGVSLIHQNAVKFGACNIRCIEGRAPDDIPFDREYTHVYFGGTDGQMETMIEQIRSRQSGPIRFVASAITLETLTTFLHIKETHPEYRNFEIRSIQSGMCEPLGSYHRWKDENTIYIASFEADGSYDPNHH